MGMKNVWEEVPVAQIAPDTMEAFLDEFCLTSKGGDVTNADLEVTYNYSFLAPPVEEEEDDLDGDGGGGDAEEQKIKKKPDSSHRALPETESLWYLSQSKQHRHLLKHPVVGSFLWLKWHRIEGFVNRNLRLYLLFVLALSWYVFERFGGVRSRATEIVGGSLNKNESFCSPLSGRRELRLGFWFWAFLAHVVLVQFALMARDWRRGCQHGCCSASKAARICMSFIFEAFVILVVALILVTRYFDFCADIPNRIIFSRSVPSEVLHSIDCLSPFCFR